MALVAGATPFRFVLAIFTLHDVYGADEAFVTGTFGGIMAVRAIDGRALAMAPPGGLTQAPARSLSKPQRTRRPAADIARVGAS